MKISEGRGQAALVLAAGIVALLGGCRRDVPGYYGTVVPRHPPNEMWINNGGEPEWVDPGRCSDAIGSTVIFAAFSGLTQPHPKTLQPMPEIARGWKITDEGRRYVFALRTATWSDGHPLTAHDFVYSWRRVLDPATGSKYSSFLYPLENAEAFGRRALWITGLGPDVEAPAIQAAVAAHQPVAEVRLGREPGTAFVWLKAEGPEGAAARTQVIAALNGKPLGGKPVAVKVADETVVGVRALDDQTLEVRLENPVPYFLSLTMFYTAMPVPRHLLERLAKEGKNPDLWTRPEYFVSNGAFVLKEWKFRQYMVMAKNPRYWDAANVALDRVLLRMVEDENTVLNLYRTGDLDYMGSNGNLPNELLDHLRGYRDFHSDPQLAVYYYWLNAKVPPLDNPLVRRALSLAIDRESIVKFITRAHQIPTASLIPDGLAGYSGLNAPLFDPEAARKLLREAGYGPGKPFPQLTLSYNTLEGHRLIAQAVQQMWKKNLGIDIELENQEWKVYLAKMDQMDFQIARGAWIGDYADPFTFMELLSATSGNNHSNWRNAEYDRLLGESNRTLDPAARLAVLRRAESLAMAEAPMIPIYIYTRSEVVKPYVRGLWGNIQSHPPMKYWRIDPRFYNDVPDVPREDPLPPVIQPEAIP